MWPQLRPNFERGQRGAGFLFRIHVFGKISFQSHAWARVFLYAVKASVSVGWLVCTVVKVFARLRCCGVVSIFDRIRNCGVAHCFTAGQDASRAGFEHFTGPVIAAVNGAAATAGFEMALACDIIFVAKGAKFLDTHARVGIVPGWGLSQRLPRIIGINRAKEVSLSGNALTAERAYEWGLANRVCEAETLLQEAKALALDICSCVPGVMEQVKTMIDTGYTMHFEDAMAYELETGIESSKQIDSAQIGERREAAAAERRGVL